MGTWRKLEATCHEEKAGMSPGYLQQGATFPGPCAPLTAPLERELAILPHNAVAQNDTAVARCSPALVWGIFLNVTVVA